MSDILSAAEIADIQDAVAPAAGDELVSIAEVWRKPVSVHGAVPGGAGVDEYGATVNSGTDDARTDERFAQIAEYPVRITRAGAGNEPAFGDQFVAVAPWTLTINAALQPDIGAADKLLTKRAVWTASESIVAGDVRQPVTSNGRFYTALTTGTTGGSEPAWPISYLDREDTTQEVADGGVMWVYGGYLRTFEVKDASGASTFDIVRLVRCEEVKS